jgi:hypothetical protein
MLGSPDARTHDETTGLGRSTRPAQPPPLSHIAAAILLAMFFHCASANPMRYYGALLSVGICGVGFGLLAVPIAALVLAIDYGRRAFRMRRAAGDSWKSWRWVPTPLLGALCIICAWTDWPLRYRFAAAQPAFEREALRLLAPPAPPTSRPANHDPFFDSMEYAPLNESYEGWSESFHVHGVGVFREQRVVYFFTDSWLWGGWGFVYHPGDATVPWSAVPLAPSWSSFAYMPMK